MRGICVKRLFDSFSFHATKQNQAGPRRQIQVGTAAADQARRLPTAVEWSGVPDKFWTSLHDPVVSDHQAGLNTAGGSLPVLLSNPHLPSLHYSLTFSGVFKCLELITWPNIFIISEYAGSLRAESTETLLLSLKISPGP